MTAPGSLEYKTLKSQSRLFKSRPMNSFLADPLKRASCYAMADIVIHERVKSVECEARRECDSQARSSR